MSRFVILGTAVLTYSLQVTTERNCLSSSTYIILEGDTIQLYFEYGYSMDNVDFTQCFRESDSIFSFGLDFYIRISQPYASRASVSFDEKGMKLTLAAAPNDRTVFLCYADIILPAVTVQSAVDLSSVLPYGKLFLEHHSMSLLIHFLHVKFEIYAMLSY